MFSPASCSSISAALLRTVTAQLSSKANRHFLNNIASSAPPLKSPSGIAGRGGGVGGGCSSPGSARIRSCFALSAEISLLTMIQVLGASASK